MRRNERDSRPWIIRLLIIIVVLLVLFVIFMFIVRPGINKYVIIKQVEAQNYVFADMLVQLQNTGYYQLQMGNQTLVLVPYQPQTPPTQ